MLLLNGTRARRDAVARELHAAGLAASGRYLMIDCREEEDRFRAAALGWVASDGGEAAPAPPLEDQPATLFLDSIEALSMECQRLLAVLLDRLAEAFAAGQRRPIVRLIAGSGIELRHEVDAGRFLPELYDALDKVRLDLAAPESVAALRSAGEG